MTHAVTLYAIIVHTIFTTCVSWYMYIGTFKYMYITVHVRMRCNTWPGPQMDIKFSLPFRLLDVSLLVIDCPDGSRF